MEELTKDTKALFVEYIEDAGNWSGRPLVGGNIESSMKNNGHLTDLKKKGLITTFEHEFNRGQFETFIEWTQKGIDYARTIGLTGDANYIVHAHNGSFSVQYGNTAPLS